MLKYALICGSVVLILLLDTIFPSLKPEKSAPITGNIYGICPPIEHLRSQNQKIHPILDQLRLTPFFRTYKLNMETECPFWAMQRMCNSNKCAICECSENEIPVFWKQQQQQSRHDMFDHTIASASKDCPQAADEWCQEDEFNNKAIYVNLANNKESYTAYEGHQVWEAIYQENCMIEKFEGIDASNTCTEETLLYQLISGLHTSINMHVTTNYIDFQLNKTSPNLKMFLKSIGQHPERLKNLFFLYAVALRAVNIAEPILKQYDYTTQIDREMDLSVPNITNNLYEITLSDCNDTFKEEYFFSKEQNAFKSQMLLKEIQTKFYNISRILDCVSCEKCRLNGKMQLKGLAAAMKLLFAPQNEIQFAKLRRTEVIALVNLLHRLSESIKFYENFLQLQDNADQQLQYFKIFLAVVAVINILLISKVCNRKRSKKISATPPQTKPKVE